MKTRTVTYTFTDEEAEKMSTVPIEEAEYRAYASLLGFVPTAPRFWSAGMLR